MTNASEKEYVHALLEDVERQQGHGRKMLFSNVIIRPRLTQTACFGGGPDEGRLHPGEGVGGGGGSV
jgi:hypothetical protein